MIDPAWLKKILNDYPLLKKLSILGLIEALGGVLLAFVLGIRALADTDSGRSYRLCAGALIVGLGLGSIYYAFCPDALSSLVDPSARVWVAFGGIPILLLAVTFYLESVRTRLERGTGTGTG